MHWIHFLDDSPVIRQRRHPVPWPHHSGVAERNPRPIGLEVKLLVGVRKAAEVMRGAEVRLQIAPDIGLQPLYVAVATLPQCRVDQFARRHVKTGMREQRAQTLSLVWLDRPEQAFARQNNRAVC